MRSSFSRSNLLYPTGIHTVRYVRLSISLDESFGRKEDIHRVKKIIHMSHNNNNTILSLEIIYLYIYWPLVLQIYAGIKSEPMNNTTPGFGGGCNFCPSTSDNMP